MHLLVVILATTISSHMVYGLDQRHRDFILKIHNDYRKNVRNACQMERMEYDKQLERYAQAWANKCVFEHEYKGRGENLAWNSAKSEETVLMTTAAKQWYDEIKDYSYGQHSCGVACHYTQLVWGTTNRVGCATKRCGWLDKALFTRGYANAWYLVCFYGPPGNMNGVKPYLTRCDKQCKEGQKRDSEGLCVKSGSGGSSTGARKTGGSTSKKGNKKEKCKDSRPECVGWAKRGECKKNKAWMLPNCKKSCQVCRGSKKSGKDKKKGSKKCPQDNRKCAYWKKKGMCQKNKKFMKSQCPRLCGFCK